MKKAAFVELYEWHTECIYSHLLYLRTEGYHVEFICNRKQRARVEEISALADKTVFVDAEDMDEVRKCRDYVIDGGFDKVVLGTVYNNKAVKAFVSGRLARKVDLFGTLHDLRHLRRTQRLIGRGLPARIRRYFVLARYIADNFPKRSGACCDIPFMFQPEYPDIKIDKPDGEIWIAVPGMVNMFRRDYGALMPPDGQVYGSNLKFILLGYGGDAAKELTGEFKKRGVERNFVMFDDYVAEPEFYSWIRRCDYIMPLVHPGCRGFERYLATKITGNLNVALNFRKPMLCDRAFAALPDYVPHSIFFSRDELFDTVNSLGRPDTGKFYDAAFERTHSLESLSRRYGDFLNQK